jgi:polyisoprenyl-teichoic acid--peptidoglycan teichoic acid transferase
MLRTAVFLMIFLILSCHLTAAQPEVDGSIPDPMPLVEVPDDTTIFLLFGTATDNPSNPGLADMVMLVAVNRSAGSVAMLSIPRDLYVYVPDHGMKKINTTYFYGETEKPEGGGTKLLIDTIRYNLGVEVDYYAHVNYAGFMDIIDTLGGIDIAVDCTIRDWKLKSRELNKLVAENYEMFMLPVGVHHVDALTALWYVRSRITSSDLDRGRRQQDVLRAIWRKVREGDLLTQVPALWGQITESVDTDLALTDLLGFIPFAADFDANRMTSYRFKMGDQITNGFSPSPERAAILVPNREAIGTLLRQFVQPPTPNQVSRAKLTVEIVNASGVKNLATVAADRLAQEGFLPVIVQENTHYRNYTAIYDYTGATRGSPLPDLKRVLRVTDEGVTVEPNPDRTADYKIYLGNSYLYWSCTRDVIQPALTLDENGNVVAADETDS